MISSEQYRNRIGVFFFTAQKNYRAIGKSIIIGSCISSRGFRSFLKPAPFITLFVFFPLGYPKSYEIIVEINEPILIISEFSRNGRFSLYPQYDCEQSTFSNSDHKNLLLSGDIESNPGLPYIQSPGIEVALDT